MSSGWLEPLGRLPDWLESASDTAVIAEALTEATRASDPGHPHVECRSSRIRLREEGWLARYDVAIADRSTPDDKVVHLSGSLAEPVPSPPPPTARGRLTDGTWCCRVPRLGLGLRVEDEDEALPMLADLLDPRRAGVVLERAVNGARPATARLHIDACEPQVMRYKPGSRCTVRYRVAATWTDGRHPPEVVVAKTYRGDKGRVAFDAMGTLWMSKMATSPNIRIAEPLGFLSAEKLLVQGPVPEQTTVKSMVEEAAATGERHRWERLGVWVERAADGLADLHGCDVLAMGERRWQTDFDETRDLVTRLARSGGSSLASASRAADDLLEAIGARARSLRPDSDVPSHGSFRPAQILVSGGDVSVIDFDGFCRAEPAMDVALFSASVQIAGVGAAVSAGQTAAELTRCIGHLTEITDRFVTRYSLRRAVDLDRVAAWEGLDLLVQLIHGWTKVKQARLDGAVPLLDAHLDRLGL